MALPAKHAVLARLAVILVCTLTGALLSEDITEGYRCLAHCPISASCFVPTKW
jgi:hypothetical protein